MPSRAPTPDPSPPESGDGSFHVDLGADIERLRARLVDLYARRRLELESEQQRRADRASGREPDTPGIPE